ncbi:L-ascorbate metabolism protein UlaG (beta-lactamase superfamily) [Actinophytocola oryzae]|uniref:L-ascorbate metabolism protein UlaG (Beta-lactamase superfamily) n=1 Tax=Actinophytocola oryzae TaxID=502181 RepID=A0A4R7VV83_9PSEU|nr:L-ascorbate metabolism protein UlaG (beta-lactamase superfamily) [Actinophytocola oryzae]
MRRSALLAPVGALVGAGALAGWQVPAAVGGQPRGERLERMRRSPQFRDGAFHNAVEAAVAAPSGSALRDLVFGKEVRRPTRPVPLVGAPDFSAVHDGLRVSWLGHATVLVEVERKRFLFDPVWSDRVSPSTMVGPKRLHPVPWSVDDLPELDAVVISHDHYDHLDMMTVRRLFARQPSLTFVVPLGVGAHLERWRVPTANIVELDWDERTTVDHVEVVATAARHFSGRLRPGGNGTLWASWVIAGRDRKVFYTGDSGHFSGYERIGAEHGPFDVTLIQVGAYSPYWPDIHMTPEEGVATHRAVRGELLVPVHWGTFNLAMHSWSEPVERLLKAGDDIRIAVPKPGQALDVDDLREPEGWWREVA